MNVKRVSILFLLGAFCLLSERAFAQSVASKGIAGWFELNTYHPASSPNDWWSLERGRVLKHLQLGFFGLLQFDNDPLTWQKKVDGSYTETEVEVERFFVSHFALSMGLFDHAQLSFELPLYFDNGSSSGSSRGVGDIRFGPKVAFDFKNEKKDIGIALYLPISVPSGNPESFTGNDHVGLEPRLAWDIELGNIVGVLNGGAFLIRESETRFDRSKGSAIFAGAGIGFSTLRKTGTMMFLAEVSLGTQVSDFFARQSTESTITAGSRYVFKNGIIVNIAIGTGMSAGIGVPNFRLITGLGIVPRPLLENRRRVVNEKDTLKTDSDRDGIPDTEDLCPAVPEDFDGYDDGDGCEDPDNDKDGIPDPRDSCIMAPENMNGVEDDDGCPDEDTDNDGLADAKDECPDRAEDKDGFKDEDGCPDLDNDFDDFVDEDDKCPSLPESVSRNGIKDGCPDTLNLEGTQFVFRNPITFVAGTADITQRSTSTLEDLAQAMRANEEWTEIRIEVSPSTKAASDASVDLAERRAMSVLRALVALGVPPDQLVAQSASNNESQQEAMVSITISVQGADR